MHVPPNWLHLHAANDTLELCRTILQAVGVQHVFTGMLECLPQCHAEVLQSLRPQKQDTLEEKAAAHSLQLSYLQLKAHRVFSENMTSAACASHPALQCPLVSPGGWSPQFPQPLRINFSGPMCTPWSKMGKMEGPSDPSMESFFTWKQKIQHAGLDIIYLENSEFFDWPLFANDLTDRFLTMKVVFSPEEDWQLQRSQKLN